MNELRTSEVLNRAADLIEGSDAFKALKEYLTDHLVQREVFLWNDKQTSAEPVIEALRACALIESARESARILGEPAPEREEIAA